MDGKLTGAKAKFIPVNQAALAAWRESAEGRA
jgi:hypothetical protein